MDGGMKLSIKIAKKEAYSKKFEEDAAGGEMNGEGTSGGNIGGWGPIEWNGGERGMNE